MSKFEQNWQTKPMIGIPLGVAGLALAYVVREESLFPRLLVWFTALVMLLTALGAFISTGVVVDDDGSLILRTSLFGLPISTVRVAAGSAKAVELIAHYSDMNANDPERSGSKSLRVKLQVRHAGGSALVKADAVRLPAKWSPPDDDAEVIRLLQNGGKGEFQESARRMADALGCPMKIIRNESGPSGEESGR